MVNCVFFFLVKKGCDWNSRKGSGCRIFEKSLGTGRYVLDKQVGESLDDLKSCVIGGYTWNTTDFASWRS